MAKYSIVVPLHNREASVTSFYAGVNQVMEQTGESFELILVEDGSTDRTFRLLNGIAAVDSRVLVVKLRRHFGKTASLAAGVDHASGEYVLTMVSDSDQNPEDIPRFIEKLEDGYDVVSGTLRPGSWMSIRGRIPARCGHWLLSKLTGARIHDLGTDFNAYRRHLIQSVPLYGDMNRFIPALAGWYGASIGEVQIGPESGPSNPNRHGLFRELPVFFDVLTVRFLLRYMNRPLHFFGRLAALGALLAAGTLAYLLGVLAFHPHLSLLKSHEPMLVFSSLLVLAAIQLLALGLLCELLVRHYHTVDTSTPYVVDRLIRFGAEPQAVRLPEKHGSGFQS